VTEASSHDLSGSWTGLFNYPSLLPTTHFQAVLKDAGGLVTGLTTEEGESLHIDGIVHATIEGRHDGIVLHFTKIYDDLAHAGHPIDYEGTITEGGDEISGRWDIKGVWSGTFLMVRNPGQEEAVEREAGAEIPVG